MSSKNIIVAFGGVSPEHEVSVITAMQAIDALKETSYNLIPLYVSKEGTWHTGEYLLELDHYEDLNQIKAEAFPCTFSHDEYGKPVLKETEKRNFFSSLKTYDIYSVLISFHGSAGENGSFQGICDFYNVPYTGCDVLSSALGMDKVRAKQYCDHLGIPVVPGENFTEKEWVDRQEQILNECEYHAYPLIVKPVHLGSSIGVRQADDRDRLIEAVETAFRYDHHLLVEKAIQPLTEINCSVMGYGYGGELETSVCERPVGKEETLSFEDKYQSDDGEGSSKGMASTDRVIPADIPEEKSTRILELSKTIFEAFGASGLARLDFLLNPDQEKIYFNEINTIPGSFSFYLWEESGYSFREILLKLIAISRDVHKEKNRRVQSYETNLLSQKAAKGIKGLKGKESNN